MNNNGTDFALIEKLLPEDVRNYFKSIGWLAINNVPGEISIYRHPENELAEAVIPLNPGYSDYTSMMAKVVLQISKTQGRSIVAVVNDLLLPTYADVMRFRLDAFNTQRGTIPFIDGLALLNGAKKAILSSACSIVQPRRFHPKLSRAEADAFFDRCELGQTERGSYIASVICPVELIPDTDTSNALFPDFVTSEPEDPFGRKVTKALIASIDDITASIRLDQIDNYVASLRPDSNISANLCEAIAELEPDGNDSALEISVNWALIGKPPINTPSQVLIPKHYFPAFRSLSRQLRPAQPKEKPDRFIGFVDTLEGSTNDDGLMQGPVIISFVTDEGPIKARIILNHDEYTYACDAHRDVMHVSVHGLLNRGTRIGTITDHSGFQILTL